MRETNGNLKDRTVYFDYLRVIATFAVMILHVSSQNWRNAAVSGFEWGVFNFFDSVVRWSVPVFVMISGALFLDRDIPLRKIYSKYILRMVTSFCVWSVFYSFFEKGTINTKILAALQGHYHMWFILMIIGLYMCIPFIKPIAANADRCRYFLLLSFFAAFLVPGVKTLSEDFGSEKFIIGINAISNNVSNLSLNSVMGYVGYFVLGYYLSKAAINKKQRYVIYMLGMLGFAATIVLSLMVSLKNQEPCIQYYGNFTINVLLEALAVFTWFKYKGYSNQRLNAFIQRLAKYSFGAYLLHTFVLEQLNERLGLNTLSFNPILSVIFISIIVAVVSFGVSAILNHIPVVKKYAV